MDRVIADVRQERQRQDKKWGVQNHDPFTYLTVLGEEFGEACQAALHAHFGGRLNLDDYRTEMVQVAAVAVAAIECIDRGEWPTCPTPPVGLSQDGSAIAGQECSK